MSIGTRKTLSTYQANISNKPDTLKKLKNGLKKLQGRQVNKKYWIFSPKGRRVTVCFELPSRKIDKLHEIMQAA